MIAPRLVAAGFVAASALATAFCVADARSSAGHDVELAFTRESYGPGSVARLRFFTGVRGATLELFHAGVEPGRTRRRDAMRGVSVAPRSWVGRRRSGTSLRIAIPRSESGLYFAKVTSADGGFGYAPFVIRPSKLGAHHVAVVLPTQTWQAYNFRDDDGDGRADTWYADNRQPFARLGRPFLDRGVPPHFRHYDLPLLHWLARTGKQVDYLADSDLDGVARASELAAAYDLVVFPGHHEYVTAHEYALVRRYRDLGGNLMFLFANDFFWRIARKRDVMTRITRWRAVGRPEAELIGVQYRGNDRGARKGPWIVRKTAGAPWLFRGTGLQPGSRLGSGGIEIDHTSPASPRGVRVLAEIPDLYGPGFTAQMTYYETPFGAKVFAAGAFGLVESVLEPDGPLPDARARRSQVHARRLLENLWGHLSAP
jgi:hypothetical protein